MQINTILILQLVIVIYKVVQLECVRSHQIKKKPLIQEEYHVKLYILKPDSKAMQCGGVCVHPHWILTSAYCLENKGKAVPGNVVFIIYGKISPKFSPNHVHGKKCVLHPGFSVETGNNDIGLLKIRRLNTLRLGSLPFQFFTRAMINEQCHLAGWGGSRTLDRIEVRLEGNCKDNNKTICATALNGGTVYEGDLGSPLFCGYVIIAIASGKMFPGRWNKEYKIDERYNNIRAIKEFPVYAEDQINAKRLIFISLAEYFNYITDMILGGALDSPGGASSCITFNSFPMIMLVIFLI